MARRALTPAKDNGFDCGERIRSLPIRFRQSGQKQPSDNKDGDNGHQRAPEEQHDEEDEQGCLQIFHARNS